MSYMNISIVFHFCKMLKLQCKSYLINSRNNFLQSSWILHQLLIKIQKQPIILSMFCVGAKYFEYYSLPVVKKSKSKVLHIQFSLRHYLSSLKPGYHETFLDQVSLRTILVDLLIIQIILVQVDTLPCHKFHELSLKNLRYHLLGGLANPAFTLTHLIIHFSKVSFKERNLHFFEYNPSTKFSDQFHCTVVDVDVITIYKSFNPERQKQLRCFI